MAPARFTGRNTWPESTPAADVQPSIATFTQVGIGAVRTPTVFPDEIYNAPPSVPLLDVFESERSHLRSSQSAPEEHGENRSIAQAANH